MAEYQKVLKNSGMLASITDGYDCYQNALAEKVNGIFKQEFLLYRCKDIDELKTLVDRSIQIYNEMRPHISLGLKTPGEVHKKPAAKHNWLSKNRHPISGRDSG